MTGKAAGFEHRLDVAKVINRFSLSDTRPDDAGLSKADRQQPNAAADRRMHKISPLPVMTDTAMVQDQHTLNLNITAVSNPSNELSQSLNIRTDGKNTVVDRSISPAARERSGHWSRDEDVLQDEGRWLRA